MREREVSESQRLIEYISTNEGASDMKTILRAVEVGEGGTVADNIDKSTLDHETIGKLLLEKGYSEDVAPNIQRFDDSSRQKIVDVMMNGHEVSIADNLEVFEGLVDHQQLADKLIEEQLGILIYLNRKRFKDLDEKTLKLVSSYEEEFDDF